MKKPVSMLGSLLLLFNGLGALYGGWSLMADPSGTQLQLPLPVLEHTPFNDFLIPGIVLFVVLGVFSITALLALFFAIRHAALYVVAEGSLLTAWTLIQVWWTQWFHPLQVLMGTTGLLLIACGGALYRMEKRKKAGSRSNKTRFHFISNIQP